VDGDLRTNTPSVRPSGAKNDGGRHISVGGESKGMSACGIESIHAPQHVTGFILVSIARCAEVGSAILKVTGPESIIMVGLVVVKILITQEVRKLLKPVKFQSLVTGNDYSGSCCVRHCPLSSVTYVRHWKQRERSTNSSTSALTASDVSVEANNCITQL